MIQLLIHPAQSKNARRTLGLTQAQLAEQAGASLSYIKRFETGRESGGPKFQQKLIDFFSSKKIDLDEMTDEAVSSVAAPPSGYKMVKSAPRQCFFIDDRLPQDVIDSALDRMDANDDRIAALLPMTVKSGFTGLSGDTEDALRETYQRAAESYLLFRMLQGRNIIAPPADGAEAQSVGALLAQYQAEDFMSILKTLLGGPADKSSVEHDPIEE